MESTYGGRKHPQPGEALAKLERVVNATIGRGGRLIVPAFAVGRTQQLVLLLHQLINERPHFCRCRCSSTARSP